MEENKQKSAGEKIKNVIGTILLSPFILIALLVYFVFFIVPSPIERKIYKKSIFFNCTNQKYLIGITHTIGYKEYCAVKKVNNDTQIKLDEDNALCYETENYLVLTSWFDKLSYSTISNCWEVEEKNADNVKKSKKSKSNFISLRESRDRRAKEVFDEEIDKPIKILVNKKFHTIELSDCRLAEKDKRFIVYNSYNELSEKIKNL